VLQNDVIPTSKEHLCYKIGYMMSCTGDGGGWVHDAQDEYVMRKSDREFHKY